MRRMSLIASVVMGVFFVSLSFLAIVEARGGGGRGGGKGGTVSVRGYYRKDGTYVRPYTRSAPGSRLSNNFSYRPIPLFIQPKLDAERRSMVAAGMNLTVIEDRGTWLYIETPDERRGWILKDSLQEPGAPQQGAQQQEPWQRVGAAQGQAQQQVVPQWMDPRQKWEAQQKLATQQRIAALQGEPRQPAGSQPPQKERTAKLDVVQVQARFYLVPLFSTPDPQAEQVGKVYFGVDCRVIEERESWLYIETPTLHRRGWIWREWTQQ